MRASSCDCCPHVGDTKKYHKIIGDCGICFKCHGDLSLLTEEGKAQATSMIIRKKAIPKMPKSKKEPV